MFSNFTKFISTLEKLESFNNSNNLGLESFEGSFVLKSYDRIYLIISNYIVGSNSNMKSKFYFNKYHNFFYYILYIIIFLNIKV